MEQVPLAKDDDMVIFAGGTHRDPKRQSLPKHRDADRARDMIHSARKTVEITAFIETNNVEHVRVNCEQCPFGGADHFIGFLFPGSVCGGTSHAGPCY